MAWLLRSVSVVLDESAIFWGSALAVSARFNFMVAGRGRNFRNYRSRIEAPSGTKEG